MQSAKETMELEGEPRLRLFVEDDQGKTAVYPLLQNEITIGRATGNVIQLNQRNISREHIKLVQNGDGRSLLVYDLESYMGVRINDQLVQARGLFEVGDLLQLGDYSITLVPESDADFDEPPPVPLDESEQAKLVVVSSNLAGETFLVQHRETRVGRTNADNEIVLNHRSISRSHAKLIYRDGEFIITDLNSANGLRVKGEEQSVATLRNGDFIELGQVKLRYVAPGDQYQFEPAHINDVELDLPTSPRPAIVVLGVVTLAALIVALLSLFRG